MRTAVSSEMLRRDDTSKHAVDLRREKKGKGDVSGVRFCTFLFLFL